MGPPKSGSATMPRCVLCIRHLSQFNESFHTHTRMTDDRRDEHGIITYTLLRCRRRRSVQSYEKRVGTRLYRRRRVYLIRTCIRAVVYVERN